MKSRATILASAFTMIACSTLALSVAGASPITEMPPVVTTAWLAAHLEDPDLITLHIGPPGSYEKGHVPGARKASLRRLIRINEAGIRDEMLPAEDIAGALSELGIDGSSRVVVYLSEENAAWAAARYLLTLEYVGLTGRASYLDGGLPKWLAAEHPVSTDVPAVEATDLAVATVPGVVVDTEWLRTRLDEPGIAIVDGRPAAGYAGTSGHWDRLGHIPGAGNVPFFTLLAEDPSYLLKSREELEGLFSEAGVSPGDTVVVYCGTGLWASLPYLAARHLGYDVRLYDGSFQEWSATRDLPVARAENSEG